MSNFAAALKHEIIRLARREARSLTKSVHQASARFRKDIAELKREGAKARADLARLQRQARTGAPAPIAEATADKVRYSAASVSAQRRRLGFSAEAFGKLIGVTGHTVYKWEHGAARPRRAQFAAFAVVRALGKTEANERLKSLRAKAPKGRKTTKKK